MSPEIWHILERRFAGKDRPLPCHSIAVGARPRRSYFPEYHCRPRLKASHRAPSLYPGPCAAGTLAMAHDALPRMHCADQKGLMDMISYALTCARNWRLHVYQIPAVASSFWSEDAPMTRACGCGAIASDSGSRRTDLYKALIDRLPRYVIETTRVGEPVQL